MAYLDVTLLNDFQATSGENDKRFNALGIVDSVKDATQGVDYIPPSVREQMSTMSSLRNARIPVIKDQNVTVVTTPGFGNIPSNLAETDDYFFQAYDVFSGFRFYPASFQNNAMDADYFYQQTMQNVLEGCGNTIETILAARLEERKSQVLDFTTQVSQGDGTFTFDAPSDTLRVNKAAQKETMFFNLQQLMAANKLGGNYRLVTSRAGLSVQLSEAAKFGSNNDKNLQALGMLPMDRLYESDNISAGSDIFNGWFLRDGSIGMYENYPYDFANGTTVSNRQWSITDVELPFTRMRANVYVNTDATDATALVSAGTDSNLIMTHFEEMAVWFRFYVVYRYNTELATKAQDIVKIQGLTT
jgi:hypothetical protein